MHAMRSLTFALALAACGGSSKQPETAAPPAAPTTTAGLELGEITLFTGADPMFKLHATGATEMAYRSGTLAVKPGETASSNSLPVQWKSGQTFKADGTIEENGAVKAKINADGSITGVGTPDKVEMTVTADKATIPGDKGTLEIALAADGKITISGVPTNIPPDQQPRVAGADTPGKRRTALIIIALVLGETKAPPPPAASSIPAAK